MTWSKPATEYTKEWLKVINILLKIVSKYQLAKLIGIHHPSLYRWLNGTHNISEFYYKVLIQMYAFIKSSIGPDHKFSASKWIARVKQWKEEPAYRDLKTRLNQFDDDHESYVFETNKKHLKEKYKACQLCGVTNRGLEVHHIVTRGEAGGTAMVHTMKNLILLCDECHRLMHDKKTIRNILIKDRKLYFLKQVNVGWNRNKAHGSDPQGETIWED